MPGTVEISVCSVLLATVKGQSMRLPIKIATDKKDIETEALLDSGAEGIFMSRRLAEEQLMDLQPLKEPIKARNVDGTPNKLGTITHFTDTTLRINGRQFKTTFLITGLGKEDVILGLPWLRKVNPIIDWRKATLEFRNEDRLARVRAIIAKT
jgi:predicted aspartyl protease